MRHLQVVYPAGKAGFSLRRRQVKAVDDVSFSLEAGATIGIVGESGSGKSTLGRAILGLAPISAGDVEISGQDVRRIPKSDRMRFRRMVQCIFQDPYSSLSPSHTVDFILKEPLQVHGLLEGNGTRQVDALLDLVGLPIHLKGRRPSQLSGGQCQRVAVARALALGPKLIICDEPTSSLDVSIQAQIISLLADFAARFGLSYVFISHDLAVVRQIAGRVMVMFGGRAVEEGQTERIFRSPGHPYTAALLSAVPVPDPVSERSRPRLALSDDNLDDSPSRGCAFRSRCWLWQELGRPELCADRVPQLPPAASGGVRSACHFSDQVVAKFGLMQHRNASIRIEA